MDPVGGLVEDVMGLPWLLGLAVGGCAAAATIVIAHAIRHGSWTPPDRLSAMGRGALHRMRALGGPAAETRWLCEACRSWNGPEAASCYHGCGPRRLREMPMPGSAANDGEADRAERPPPQSGGRHTRRG
ncbi:MAG: hypothetical protein WCH74_09710 [Chloroflexota bacterium]